ncbi:MAG: GNAT family N-acetyltransferase [Spirochaetia bacterium]|nr:GNAT family N-acetyltransferase [Spirochaetia bacterium]
MKYKVEEISDKYEKEAIQVLSMSFVNDPGIAFFSPNPVKRMHHTIKMVSGMSGILNSFGKKFMIKTNDKIAAVAMWVPPGKNINNWRLIKAGFILIPFVMGLRVFRKIMMFLDIAMRLQEEHMENRDHWHLFYVGVNPASQRNGYGKAVISEILGESDKTKIPVFVQVFTEEGQRFFKKNGFEIISKTKFSEDCIMNCMIREPKQKYPQRVKPDAKKISSKKVISKPAEKKLKNPKKRSNK